MSEIVNVDNFARAETARMCDGILARSGGINRSLHLRGPVLEIPDVGDRYLSVMVVDEDHDDNAVLREPARHQLGVEAHGARFVNLSARIFVDLMFIPMQEVCDG